MIIPSVTCIELSKPDQAGMSTGLYDEYSSSTLLVRVLSIWCPAFRITFGSFQLPCLVLPCSTRRQHFLVKSGVIESPCQILLKRHGIHPAPPQSDVPSPKRIDLLH